VAIFTIYHYNLVFFSSSDLVRPTFEVILAFVSLPFLSQIVLVLVPSALPLVVTHNQELFHTVWMKTLQVALLPRVVALACQELMQIIEKQELIVESFEDTVKGEWNPMGQKNIARLN